MKTQSIVSSMTVGDAMSKLEFFLNGLVDAADTLLEKVGSGGLGKRKAAEMLSKEIQAVFTSLALTSILVAFRHTFNKNGVSAEDCAERHTLFEVFGSEIGMLLSHHPSVSDSLDFDSMAEDIIDFCASDGTAWHILRFLKKYYGINCDELVEIEVTETDEIIQDYPDIHELEELPPGSSSDIY